MHGETVKFNNNILYAKCLKFSLYLTEDVSVLQGLKGGNLRVV